MVLSQRRIGHQRIFPHCPEHNSLVERSIKTIKEKLADRDLDSYYQAKIIFQQTIFEYNHVRLHSTINYLPPWIYYRGDPETISKERRQKMEYARNYRKQRNILKMKSIT